MRNIGTDYKLKEAENPSFISGRCGEILVDGKNVGIFGEVSPGVITDFGLDYPVAAAEIDMHALF